MVTSNDQLNARDLREELTWLMRVVETRYRVHHGQSAEFESVASAPRPELKSSDSLYAQFHRELETSWEERFVVLLAMAPAIHPNLLDSFLRRTNSQWASDFIGGGANHASFTPTVETALFLLAGDDLERRFQYLRMFAPDSLLIREEILKLDWDPARQPLVQARLSVSDYFLSLLTAGREYQPPFSASFPARKITTHYTWKELIVPQRVKDEFRELKAFLKHGETMLNDWGLGRSLAPGYKCLFHGPAGVGKTLAACLVGKEAGLDVYRIDLSMVVSKYIGETEKNLAGIFNTLRSGILFFDEADALFSKRTEIKDAHDRHSNQEIAYLLQRVEDYRGIVILATNMKANMDEAFVRRFQSIVQFPMPGPVERRALWENGFSEKADLEKTVDLIKLAEKYTLSGGSIMNVIRYASLMTLAASRKVILLTDILEGIKREYSKEGKSL